MSERRNANARKRVSTGFNGVSKNQPLPSPTKQRKRVALNRGQVYELTCDQLGSFRIRGGSTGGLRVTGCRVIIRDLNGEEIFSDGGITDFITLQDETAGTIVQLNCDESESDKMDIGDIYREDTLGNFREIQDAGRTIKAANAQHPLQIIAERNTETYLKGFENRTVLINGNGGYLRTTGKLIIRLRGSIQTVTHEGPQRVDINAGPHGSVCVTQRVQNNGTGALIINGSTSGPVINQGERGVTSINGRVQGEIRNESDGAIIVHGVVTGNVTLEKNGLIFCEGSVNGDLIQNGNGVISVIGTIGGKYTINGNGTVHIFKTAQSKAEVYRNCFPGTESPPTIPQVQLKGVAGSITLEKGKLFLFKSTPIGSFRIRSGFSGNIQVRDSQVTILDTRGTVFFSGGAIGDIVNLEDTPNGSVVVILAGGNRLDRNPQRKAGIVRKIPGIFTGEGAEEAFKFTLPMRSLQIVSGPGEKIILNISKRNVFITGQGGHLTTHGATRVEVVGFLESVEHSGQGKLSINAQVTDSVTNSGVGFTAIEGNVKGDVICKEGVLSVFGDVGGRISQLGGTTIVHGNVAGNVTQVHGAAIIQGKVGGDLDNDGDGAVVVVGSFEGQVSMGRRGLIHHFYRGTNSNEIYFKE